MWNGILIGSGRRSIGCRLTMEPQQHKPDRHFTIVGAGEGIKEWLRSFVCLRMNHARKISRINGDLAGRDMP